jgi:hypothetical protein
VRRRGRCYDFAESEKLLKKARGWRVGAKKLSRQISNFPALSAKAPPSNDVVSNLLRSDLVAARSINVIRPFFSLHGSYILAPSLLLLLCYLHILDSLRRHVSEWSYGDDHCAYQRSRMTVAQTTIIGGEGIGSLN